MTLSLVCLLAIFDCYKRENAGNSLNYISKQDSGIVIHLMTGLQWAAVTCCLAYVDCEIARRNYQLQENAKNKSHFLRLFSDYSSSWPTIRGFAPGPHWGYAPLQPHALSLPRVPIWKPKTVASYICRAVATGPAAAGPMFGRIHKFSTILFGLSVKPRTKQSAWNNKQGKANMCGWFWICNLLIYFSAHVSQIGRSASKCLPGTRVPWAITVPVWPLSGAWCQSAWCAATEFEGSVFPVGWMLHQGLHRIPTRIVASSKNLLLWGRQGGPAHFSHTGHKCCQ